MQNKLMKEVLQLGDFWIASHCGAGSTDTVYIFVL